MQQFWDGQHVERMWTDYYVEHTERAECSNSQDGDKMLGWTRTGSAAARGSKLKGAVRESARMEWSKAATRTLRVTAVSVAAALLRVSTMYDDVNHAINIAAEPALTTIYALWYRDDDTADPSPANILFSWLQTKNISIGPNIIQPEVPGPYSITNVRVNTFRRISSASVFFCLFACLFYNLWHLRHVDCRPSDAHNQWCVLEELASSSRRLETKSSGFGLGLEHKVIGNIIAYRLMQSAVLSPWVVRLLIRRSVCPCLRLYNTDASGLS